MGDTSVRVAKDPAEIRAFWRALLDDLLALEQMSTDGSIEKGVRRIGFEQEMFLIDSQGRPAPIATEVLAGIDDPDFIHEIGLFNLEYVEQPKVIGPGVLTSLEEGLLEAVARVRLEAKRVGGDVYLGGILPSIDTADLIPEMMTPLSRYQALNEVIVSLAGGQIRTLIQGRDNLQFELDNVMLEACTTSIQIHIQVDPDHLPATYNTAQVVAAPLVAIAANAPLLLQHRLWHESRIPTFQQSVDIRPAHSRARDTWRRVHFGDDWVHESALEIYRDQVARHRIMLLRDTGESSLDELERGEVPMLRALTLHNGSLYRWNRPCYGVTDGRPHLRIEHRPLSAGPTIIDEVANTAFYLGLMRAMGDELGDVRDHFTFSDAKTNFVAAARYGVEASIRWIDGESMRAKELILERLLPMARRGLEASNISDEEIDRYLSVIRDRATTGITGARWTLDAYEKLATHRNRSARTQSLTRAIVSRQKTEQPVHTWAPLTDEELRSVPATAERVADIMSTDLFTVRPEDLIDVAASVMHWKNIRHVPVEDDRGHLIGMISHRDLLDLVAQGDSGLERSVREMMRGSPRTVSPTTSCADAMALLRDGTLGCLPVVDSGRLVGIVTERDLLPFAEAWFANKD